MSAQSTISKTCSAQTDDRRAKKVPVEEWDDEFDFLPSDQTLHIPAAISRSDVKVNRDLGLVRQFAENSKGE